MESSSLFPPVEPQVDGHRLRLVTDAPARLAMLIETIRAAHESLRLFYYIFADDAAGQQITAELIAARHRGVTVHVLVDGFGSEGMTEARIAALESHGISFDRFIPRWGRRYLLRNHQKMLIADEAVALIGGSNIAQAYFEDVPPGQGWHDLMLRVEGPAAGRLATYFDGLAAWIAGDKPRIKGLVSLLARHSARTGAVRWEMGGPFRRLSPLTRSLKRAVDAAARVDMIQAYFAPNWGFLRKLGRAAQRGRFRLITAARSDNVTTIAAARHCYRRLLRYGSLIYEYQPQKLHAKLVVADDAVWIGSANFDMRSLYLNAEIMLRVEDEGFANAMRDLVDRHIAQSRAITRAGHKADSPIWTRLIRLASYFIVSTLDFRLSRGINLRGGGE
jgi:cardiolipin synthase